jgi:hypothetical protein
LKRVQDICVTVAVDVRRSQVGHVALDVGERGGGKKEQIGDILIPKNVAGNVTT